MVLYLLAKLANGLVAQLDRVSVSGTEGYGFDSLRGHQKQKKGAVFVPFF